MRICCVNTFVSCGNFIRAKKIWASTVFLCIYFLPLVCTCIFLSGYLSVYPDHYMKFYRSMELSDSRAFFVLLNVLLVHMV